MSETPFGRAREIADRALDLAADERAAFLGQTCGADKELLRLARVLAGEETSTSTPADFLEPLEPKSVSSVQPSVPETIGPFQIRRVLATGGMGTIYEAVQAHPKRVVAVKTLRHGIESSNALRRFHVEVQALAELSHPAIAQVLESGTYQRPDDPHPVPYLALEMINGASDILTYAEEHDLSVPARLRLFIAVLHAVQHGHDRGIIHRDLKPGNILVDGDGHPKLIDYGVAHVRHVDPALRTATEHSRQIVGTLSYIAPESLAGTNASGDVRVDVYALGICLFELLGKHRPVDLTGLSVATALQRLMATDPPPLRSVAPGTPAELEWITARAVERSPDRRYPSVQALADDLQRHLDGEAVSAAPPSLLYRARKLAARHRVLVSVGFMALIGMATTYAAMFRALRIETELHEVAEQSRQGAEREKTRADQNALEFRQERDRARRERDNVLRLSDARRLELSKAEMNELWPAVPANIEAMDAWLERAQELLGNLSDHERRLAVLRERGEAEPFGATSSELTAMEDRLLALRECVASHQGEDPDDEFDDPAERALHVEEQEHAIAKLEQELPPLRAEDDVRLEREREYSFDEDDDSRWWHDAMQDLVRELHAFQGADLFGNTIASMRWRRQLALDTGERSAHGAQAKKLWDEARAEILDHPEYGFELPVQMGLVPLGPDPESGLWEFWHFQTGTRPESDEETGRWQITGETGVVLVLIPGATFWMGAQGRDASAPNYDPLASPNEADTEGNPVEATLSPYFLSKYELTQGQWERMTGTQPSAYHAGMSRGGKPQGPEHPVEQVSWEDGMFWLTRFGLEIPTEAQWEFGGRGRTETSWWAGTEVLDLDGVANVADTYCRDNGGPASWVYDEELNDGHMVHAPVGSYRANGFGLHDTIGNVWEWCMDDYRSGPYPEQEVSGDRPYMRKSSTRLRQRLRGGGWRSEAAFSRSASRNLSPTNDRQSNIGLRPARSISLE